MDFDRSRVCGNSSGTENNNGGFSDVSLDAWYAEAVQCVTDNGLMNGVSADRFDTDGTLTREQLATLLYRYAQFKKYKTTVRGNLSSFSDGNKVSEYAEDAMIWAVDKGLISGTDEGKLDPAGKATRAQLAAILQRFSSNVR